MKHVIIVPPKGLKGVYKDNRLWASQYVKADPQNRFKVEMKSSSPEGALQATRRAVALAGTTGEVIYAVGHGGGGSGHAGQVDFAPLSKFRVSQFLAFYDNKTEEWKGPSIAEMLRDAKEARKGTKTARKQKEKAWCTNYVASGCGKAKRQVRAIDKLQPHYDEMGKIFRANPVKRIVLLTCNVGKATTFLTELATDLGVPCRAYTDTVSTQARWEGSRRNAKIYMFLASDRYPNGTYNDRSATELLPGLTRQQRCDAKPMATP